MGFDNAADAYELLCDPARLAREIPALATLIGPGAPRVLDLACGLGDHLGALLAAGAISGGTGVDLSPAMVARARARHPDPRLAFQVGDLAQPAAAGHQVALCLGNALNCLPSMAAAFAAAQALARALPPEGRLILQVVNPARLGPDPAVVVRRRDGLAVCKTLLRLDDRATLSFTTHRRDASGAWTATTDHQALLLIDPPALAAALAATGRTPRLLGGLDGGAWSAESRDGVIVA